MERKISSKVETWINQETGEVRQVQEIEVKATDKGFDKVWLGMILAVLEIIGSKKIDVIKYLLENRSRTENTVTVSQHKIAKDVGVSVQTVNETMKKLEAADFIHRIVPGHYRINPAVIWRGSHMGRMAIMAKFSEEKAAETPEKAKADATPTPPTPTPSEAAEPRFCEEVVDRETGELCGGRLHPEVQEDGVWWFCERCRTGVKDSGSGCEYSQPSKPAA